MTIEELENELKAKEEEKKELEKKLDELQIEKEVLEETVNESKDTITSLQNENREVKKENQKLLLKVSSNKPTVKKNDEELFKGFSKYEREDN